MPLIIGVTGGIGCGKSTAAKAFAALGIETVDADDLARAVSAPDGSAYPKIVALFGDTAIQADGTLDRAFIRRQVFADPKIRTRLEAIVHPRVGEETVRRVAQWRGPYGLWIVPLLLEKPGLRERADRVLVVDCPEAQQIARIAASRGLNEDEVRAIMATQCSRDQRLALADDILDNSGSPEHLTAQVARLDRFYRTLADTRMV
ncbi:MAG: dephospho-CoA kinase [Proteobacteria bacterium]|nr:dephospho-CoA kinase [Pseudomonadota bacterium]MCL2307445.1 dephospho-CoA kinase [Pseudomonadota bacterium]